MILLPLISLLSADFKTFCYLLNRIDYCYYLLFCIQLQSENKMAASEVTTHHNATMLPEG